MRLSFKVLFIDSFDDLDAKQFTLQGHVTSVYLVYQAILGSYMVRDPLLGMLVPKKAPFS